MIYFYMRFYTIHRRTVDWLFADLKTSGFEAGMRRSAMSTAPLPVPLCGYVRPAIRRLYDRNIYRRRDVGGVPGKVRVYMEKWFSDGCPAGRPSHIMHAIMHSRDPPSHATTQHLHFSRPLRHMTHITEMGVEKWCPGTAQSISGTCVMRILCRIFSVTSSWRRIKAM